MKTTDESKFTFMTQFADRFMLGEFDVYSLAALKEMQTLSRDGRSIQPEGKAKDDRAVTLGLCTRGYIDFERRDLTNRGATYEVEKQKEAAAGDDDLAVRFMSGIMAQQFRMKEIGRRNAARRARPRGRWAW